GHHLLTDKNQLCLCDGITCSRYCPARWRRDALCSSSSLRRPWREVRPEVSALKGAPLRSPPISDSLDDGGDGFSAPDAESGQASLLVFLDQCVNEGREDPCAGGTDGVTEGDGAAVHVDLFEVKTSKFCTSHCHAAEGLVDLPKIDVG